MSSPDEMTLFGPDDILLCDHTPTWRVANRAQKDPDQPYAATLSCDRPVCLANAALWVQATIGRNQGARVSTTPIGRPQGSYKRYETHVPSPRVRRTDPPSAQEGARKAAEKMGRHKAIIIHFLEVQNDRAMFRHTNGQVGDTHVEMSAREIAEATYHEGLVTLHQIDTIRRRVQDLAAEGRLERIDRGTEPATYRLPSER